MNERPRNILTPAQSADVIRHYESLAKQEAQEQGRAYTSRLASVALRATQWRFSILPNDEPLLTIDEMNAGLAHIEHPPEQPPPEYYFAIPSLVDAYDVPLTTFTGKKGHSSHIAGGDEEEQPIPTA